MGDTSSHDRDWLLNQKTESRISIYWLVLRILIAGKDQSTYQDSFDAGPCLSTTAGDPNRKEMAPLVHWYICMYLYPCMGSLGFGTNGASLWWFRGDGACDWWYYHTRYLGEAERWKHGHFRRVKEQLFICWWAARNSIAVPKTKGNFTRSFPAFPWVLAFMCGVSE